MWRKVVSSLALAIALGHASAQAHAPKLSGRATAVRIGILNDRSGPYSEITGEGSAVAARLAAEDFGNKVLGVPIEILAGDHQNKPDVGAAIARRWFDTDGVAAIADVANSAVGFAVLNLAKERSRVFLNNSASSDFTGKACVPTAVQWNFNSFANGNVLAKAALNEGLDTWFTIAVDFAFGRGLASDLRRFVENGGGKVVGEVFHPLGNSDFSSYLLQAQASKAKVIVFGNSGSDLVNSIKQAQEFGITKTQVPAAFTVNLTDMEPMGLEAAGGMLSVSTFEWNRDEVAQAWSRRFAAKMGGALPSADQAATYSEVRHYLKAIEAAGTDESGAVLAKMRELPVDDAYTQGGRLREDGQMVHDIFLVRAKRPGESSGKGDYFSIVQTVAGKDAFQPLDGSACASARR